MVLNRPKVVTNPKPIERTGVGQTYEEQTIKLEQNIVLKNLITTTSAIMTTNEEQL